MSCPHGPHGDNLLAAEGVVGDCQPAAQLGSACDEAPTATDDVFFRRHKARGASFPLQQPAR